MVKHLRTEITIAASAERVWQILTDLAAYREWNPFLFEASGRPAKGERLTVRMKPVDGRPMTFKPTVLDAQPGRRLRWLGRLLLPGIFDGEHSFTLEPVNGGVRFVQEEDFRGVLVPLFAKSLDKGTLPAFELMNQALKARAESAN